MDCEEKCCGSESTANCESNDVCNEDSGEEESKHPCRDALMVVEAGPRNGGTCCEQKDDCCSTDQPRQAAQLTDDDGGTTTQCCKRECSVGLKNPEESNSAESSASECCDQNRALPMTDDENKEIKCCKGQEKSSTCKSKAVAGDNEGFIESEDRLEQKENSDGCCKSSQESKAKAKCCNKKKTFTVSCPNQGDGPAKDAVEADPRKGIGSPKGVIAKDSCCDEADCEVEDVNLKNDFEGWMSDQDDKGKRECREKCNGKKKDGLKEGKEERRMLLGGTNKERSDPASCSPQGTKTVLVGSSGRVSYGSAEAHGTVAVRESKSQGKYAPLPSNERESEIISTYTDILLEEKPAVIITTKIRVQNICCGKEADLIKRELEPRNGIEAVSINIVGRIGFIKHDKEIISAVDIISILNKLHLGVSIMESGDQEGAQSLRNDVIVRLGSKCAVMGVLLVLFIVVIIGRTGNHSWQKWVAIVEIIIGSLPILRKAALNWMKKIFIDINVLMLIAVAGTIALQEWIEGATLVFVFAIAEVLQQYCGYRVQAAISGIMVHIPDHAVLAETGKAVSVEEIEVGTRILVCAGEKIALDGDVVKGQASVDESSITGESMPIEKAPGCKTYSGTIVQSGYLEIRTTSTAEDSTVSKVTQMVQEAQAKASHVEKLMNQFAKIYTPLVVAVALLVFAVPAILAEAGVGNYASELHAWGIRALIVLLVACPCAMVMSVPIPMVCGITTAAKNGALVKGGNDLEVLAGVEAIAFDKTGTLTEGRFKVVGMELFRKDIDDNVMLQVVAALEMKSSHPVAAAIVNHYAGCITDKIASFGAGVGLPDVNNFKSLAGLGLTGQVLGYAVAVGNMKLLRDSGVKIPNYAENVFENWSQMGQTVIFCSVDQQLALMMGLADTPRASAQQALSMLHSLGISTIMLTGDGSGAASAVSRSVGAESYIANMKPEQKLRWIRNRQETGSKKQHTKVVMIGDGVNDGPSLAAADVGIAIGTCATALAIESANVALMTDNLVKIPELLLLSLFVKRIVIQNIALALAIKVAVVIATMAGALVLWMAILSDVLALLLVILNGLRPLFWKREDMRGSFRKRESWASQQDNHVFDLDENDSSLIQIKT